jgi:hypothetical protein
MKLGIKKLHENEWQLHIDSAFVHLDRYSLELLYSNLEHLQSMKQGQEGSVLCGLLKLTEKFLELSDAHMQLFLREIENQDLLNLVLVLTHDDVKNKVLKNVGSIMSKQLQSDMEQTEKPQDNEAVEAIKHVVERVFELEAVGKVEFVSSEQRFI